jgi:hypothetical protein
LADLVVIGAGLALVAGLAASAAMFPGVLAPVALAWPELPWPAVLGLAAAAAPAVLGLAWLARNHQGDQTVRLAESPLGLKAVAS